MHMLVWGASKPLRARVFQQSSAYAFSPNIGSTLDSDSEESLPLHVTSFSGSGFPKISAFQAEIKGMKENSTISMKIPRFAEVELGEATDYLFIPSDHLVSFYPSGISEKKIDSLRSHLLGSKEEQTTHLFKTCFVDASNLNRFKDALDLSSKVSSFDQQILDTLQTGSVDIKMERVATDTLLSRLLDGKRSTESSSNAAATTSSSGRRERSSFRDWQESNKWNLLISSLTLPRPLVPRMVITGRTNVTLEWGSPFIPGAADTTRFGFNITICSIRTNDMSPDTKDTPRLQKSLSNSEMDSEDRKKDADSSAEPELCVVWVLERGGPLLKEQIDKQQSLLAGSDVSLFSAILLDLLPHTSYIFRMTIFYDSSEGMSSEWSNIFTTQPITVPGPIPLQSLEDSSGISSLGGTEKPSKKKQKGKKSKVEPVVPVAAPKRVIGGLTALIGATPNTIILQFCSPFDDGGSPIVGYHIWYRHSDPQLFHQSWRWMGAYLSTNISIEGYSRQLVVPNLLAKTSYVFKLGAFNVIGNGTLSDSSNDISTARTLSTSQILSNMVGRLILYGKGHPLFAPSHLQKGLSTSSHTLVTLDDAAQTLSVQINPREGDREPLAGGIGSSLLMLQSTTSQTMQGDKSKDQLPVVTVAGWVSHFSPLMFSVTSECVWAHPLTVSGGERGILNWEEMQGRIAVVLRGKDNRRYHSLSWMIAFPKI
jgi:hypothetical protein